MRLAYADPPYPGKAHYYAEHPDYGGEVDHGALLSRLQEFDGWALSTDSPSLPMVLSLAADRDMSPRVGDDTSPRGVRDTSRLESRQLALGVAS